MMKRIQNAEAGSWKILRSDFSAFMDNINHQIKAWATRARAQRSLAQVFFGLACGLGAGLVMALAARVFPIATQFGVLAAALAAAALGLLIALALPWVAALRKTPLDWARRFDQQFGLGERISTALELRAGKLNADKTLSSLQLADAARAAQSVDAKKLLPLRISRRDAGVSFALAVALAIAIALPNAQEKTAQQRADLREKLQEQAQAVEQAKQGIEGSAALTELQKKQALDALNQAQQTLQNPATSAEQGLAALNDAQAKLNALRDQLANQQMQDLQRAGQNLSPDALTNALADALQREDFAKAADEMRDMLKPDGQPISPEEQQRLANQLDQMARAAQGSDPQMAQSLREAAAQLRAGNLGQADQAMERAAESLDRAAQSQQQDEALSEAQAQADALRRDLAQSSSGQSQQAGRGSPAQNGAGQSAQNGGQPRAGNPGDGPVTDLSNAAGAGNGPSAGVVNGQGGQSGHHEDTGSDNSVTVPNERLNGKGNGVGLQEENGSPSTTTGGPRTAAGGQSRVPYTQVYGQYAQAADEALQTGEVPAELRDLVRDYFSSLNPGR